MINNLQISGIHLKVNNRTKDYALKKIGSLDRFVPRKARESTFVDIRLKEANSSGRRTHICEVIMKLPNGSIAARKDSSSIRAAIDEASDTLKNQLKKYKIQHTHLKIDRTKQHQFKQSLASNNLF